MTSRPLRARGRCALSLMAVALAACSGEPNATPDASSDAHPPTDARQPYTIDVGAALVEPILGVNQTQTELRAFLHARVWQTPSAGTALQWQNYAQGKRAQILDQVIFRGASDWRNIAPTPVFESAIDGIGYTIERLRFQVIPGLWAPAVIYVPDGISGHVPAVVSLPGHEADGLATVRLQRLNINLVQRGIIVISVSWIGYGELRTPGLRHTRQNQLELCGKSALAVFYNNISNAIDVLLARSDVDPTRIAITGLSGGGWQSIIAGALDTRIALTVPVAGYSGFHTRIDNERDVGDSEQTPTDLASVVGYAELTALLAPRPALLINNLNDSCCFGAEYALQPLLDAAEPIYALLGADDKLDSHIDDVSMTHNYGPGNREAFYAALSQHFFGGSLDVTDYDVDSALRSPDELSAFVPLPPSFNDLATVACTGLPVQPPLGGPLSSARQWQATNRTKLRQLAHVRDVDVIAATDRPLPKGVTLWTLTMNDGLSVPVTELTPFAYSRTAIVVGDAGRAGLIEEVRTLVEQGVRVFAMDPLLVGEASVGDPKQCLLINSVGERCIGVQAAQLGAVARWLDDQLGGDAKLELCAFGEASSLAALIAAATEVDAIGEVRVHESMGSLREILERDSEFSDSPHAFVFGLLESFDIASLAALSAPRLVSFESPSDRARAEMGWLHAWWALFGVDHEPLKD